MKMPFILFISQWLFRKMASLGPNQDHITSRPTPCVQVLLETIPAEQISSQPSFLFQLCNFQQSAVPWRKGQDVFCQIAMLTQLSVSLALRLKDEISSPVIVTVESAAERNRETNKQKKTEKRSPNQTRSSVLEKYMFENKVVETANIHTEVNEPTTGQFLSTSLHQLLVFYE